jgi:hypothetical protein
LKFYGSFIIADIEFFSMHHRDTMMLFFGPYPISHGWARGDRGAFLYKTKDGAFFLYRISMWVGESNSIEVMSVDKAREWYERLSQHERGYKETFGAAPGEA